MNIISRSAIALILALSMGFGAMALTACGSSGSSESSSAASSEAASSESASSESASGDSASSGGLEPDENTQDDCFGDDLPAVKEK